MFDQAFTETSVSMVLRKADFYRVSGLRTPAIKQSYIASTLAIAASSGWTSSPLTSATLRGKTVYSLRNFADELAVRKINSNIRRHRRLRHPSRSSIVSNIARLLSESVPYRIYRLDIRRFYESFETSKVMNAVHSINELSIPSKKILDNLVRHFQAQGGQGVPRGLAISATLSDLMMASFDRAISDNKNVFFYARYVDDIIIITVRMRKNRNS